MLAQRAQGRQHLAQIAPQVQAAPRVPAEPLARRAYLAGPLSQPPVPRRSPAQWSLAQWPLTLQVVPPKWTRLPLGRLPQLRARSPSPLVLRARRDRAARWGPASNPPVVAASPGGAEVRR